MPLVLLLSYSGLFYHDSYFSIFLLSIHARSSPWPPVTPPDDCTELPIASNCVQWFGIMMTRLRGKKGQHVRIVRHDTEENNSFPVFFIAAPLETNPLISIVILNINPRLFYQKFTIHFLLTFSSVQ